MNQNLPKVAIIGRPNVGKSTLFNRLTGTRHALVANTPGVTRDRREGLANIAGLEFTLIDTAGLEEADRGSLAERMTNQTLEGLKAADVVLMLVDARAGIIPADEYFAGLVRESGKPVILGVNKAEGKGIQGVTEAYALGIGEPCPISAEHGEGMGSLYDELIAHFNDLDSSEVEEEHFDDILEGKEQEEEVKNIQIAIVGRPNVGKSTFINQLLGEDRVLTGPEAGITRDAISIPFEWKGHALQLVDTAGMRRKSKVAPNELEVMAVNDTRRAIQYAHVVVLMLDATQALEKQDNTIASMLAKEGRACVLVLNKWDLVNDKEEVMGEVNWQINKIMPEFRGMPIITTTAVTGENIDKVLKACMDAYKLWNVRMGTSELNRWLEDVLEAHTPPLMGGRRLKIKYITQAKSRPPTFALFVNHKGGIPEHYKRYLINSLRETFRLPGIPIRLLIRRGNNPYEK